VEKKCYVFCILDVVRYKYFIRARSSVGRAGDS
jgi:hypothetical protein